MSAPFGIVVPGRPVMVNFEVLAPDKCYIDLPMPQIVPEITFFLQPGAETSIPAGFGAVLYYSVPPLDSWEILGSVTPQKPTGMTMYYVWSMYI
jgi:hypothetical protein